MPQLSRALVIFVALIKAVALAAVTMLAIHWLTAGHDDIVETPQDLTIINPKDHR